MKQKGKRAEALQGAAENNEDCLVGKDKQGLFLAVLINIEKIACG